MYVIMRDDGKFVAMPGGDHSYTSTLTKAQTFASVESATRYGVCDNERIVNVFDLMEAGRGE